MKKAYGYSAFPTMLYLSADGELVHKYVGAGMKADLFIAIAQKAIDGKGLKSYNDRHAAGEKSATFIKEYVAILGESYESEKAAKITSDYLSSLTIEDLIIADNFTMMRENVKDLDAKAVQLLLSNKAKFTDEKMKKELAQYEYMLWAMKCSSFAKRGDNPTFDKVGYKAFLKRISASDLTDKQKSDIIDGSELSNAENMQDWKTYVKLTTSKLKKEKVSGMVSYNWALRVAQNADAKSKAKFVKVFEEAVKDQLKKEDMWKNAFIQVIEKLKK